jgi:hypothetical protein
MGVGSGIIDGGIDRAEHVHARGSDRAVPAPMVDPEPPGKST